SIGLKAFYGSQQWFCFSVASESGSIDLISDAQLRQPPVQFSSHLELGLPWSNDKMPSHPGLRCPLLAHSGHAVVQCKCPLSGVKRTSRRHDVLFAFPKRTYHSNVMALRSTCFWLQVVQVCERREYPGQDISAR